VEALAVISGPASLRQAALDAVRQWAFRPYLLDNKPVQVETTINIVFPPNR
jgi:protein TonB